MSSEHGGQKALRQCRQNADPAAQQAGANVGPLQLSPLSAQSALRVRAARFQLWFLYA